MQLQHLFLRNLPSLKTIVLAIFVLALFLPTVVFAQPDYTTQLNNTGTALLGSDSQVQLPQLIGSFIKILMSMVGVVLLILVIYAGFLWMTAGGTEKKVTKAKDILMNSIIGLVILLCSYAIVNFVLQLLR